MLKLIGILSFVLLHSSLTDSRVVQSSIRDDITKKNYETKADGMKFLYFSVKEVNPIFHNGLDCQININKDLNEPQPLVLIPGTSEFLLPNDTQGIIFLNKGDQVEVFCSDSFYGEKDVQLRTITCDSGTRFTEDGQSFEYKDLNCTKYPFHVAVRTGKKCFNDASVLNVGFEVGTRFLKVFEICFDEVFERTHYVTHEFTPAYKTHQSNFPRPSFMSSGYFNGKPVDNLYTRVSQRKTVGEILNSTTLVDKYIPETGDFYLARGHISAKSDFIFGNHHRSTFWRTYFFYFL